MLSKSPVTNIEGHSSGVGISCTCNINKAKELAEIKAKRRITLMIIGTLSITIFGIIIFDINIYIIFFKIFIKTL